MHTEAKSALRRRLLAARRAVGAPQRSADAAALTASLTAAIAERAPDTVCGYVPVGSEPGSISLLDALDAAGVRVLLPVTVLDDDGGPGPLRWGRYRPAGLVAARYGLREPDGPVLPAEEIGAAQLIVVPALAVDRRGGRLGRGAGFYDRSLPLRAPGTPLIAVVRDEEVLDEVPTGPHDVAMTHLATPGLGVRAVSAP